VGDGRRRGLGVLVEMGGFGGDDDRVAGPADSREVGGWNGEGGLLLLQAKGDGRPRRLRPIAHAGPAGLRPSGVSGLVVLDPYYSPFQGVGPRQAQARGRNVPRPGLGRPRYRSLGPADKDDDRGSPQGEPGEEDADGASRVNPRYLPRFIPRYIPLLNLYVPALNLYVPAPRPTRP